MYGINYQLEVVHASSVFKNRIYKDLIKADYT